MKHLRICLAAAGLVLLLLCAVPAVSAASPDYAITYRITIQDDGSALWNVEYRTPLATDEALDSFANYSRDLNSVYLPGLEDLMKRSAAQGAMGTGRPMTVNNFTGNAYVQTSPTGKYGLVTYSFTWTDFAKPTGTGLALGDAFAGGLYLAKDNTLVIRYPSGYTVTAAEPSPDQTGDGLIWYGIRSFGPGQPQVVLAKPAIPFPALVIIPVIAIIAIGGYIILRKRHQPADGEPDNDEAGEISGPVLSAEDMISLEEKILRTLSANGGEQFQSAIVRDLGLPKSTVSSALNELHKKGRIQKIRKGRENLIRLVLENHQ